MITSSRTPELKAPGRPPRGSVTHPRGPQERQARWRPDSRQSVGSASLNLSGYHTRTPPARRPLADQDYHNRVAQVPGHVQLGARDGLSPPFPCLDQRDAASRSEPELGQNRALLAPERLRPVPKGVEHPHPLGTGLGRGGAAGAPIVADFRIRPGPQFPPRLWSAPRGL